MGEFLIKVSLYQPVLPFEGLASWCDSQAQAETDSKAMRKVVNVGEGQLGGQQKLKMQCS
jgi:hypothetical protein